MQISVLAIGKVKAGPERELIARYQLRATATGRSLGLGGPDIVEFGESRASNAVQRSKDEAKRLLDAVPDGAFIIALDERGKNLTSEGFARKLQNLQEDGHRSVALIIGGADGHGGEVRKRADLLLSFGQFTWPHQIVRLMLMEQLYRTTTILSGHPYHRA